MAPLRNSEGQVGRYNSLDEYKAFSWKNIDATQSLFKDLCIIL